jgi:CRISPR/Cas system CMR-associated protein Cmr1 (group 7 of RAMP superfamily)
MAENERREPDMNWQRDIELLTPCFCRGAYRDQPEIRVPSIRGMVRWWFRALGGTRDQEKALFGGVHGGAVASRLVFRVSGNTARKASPDPGTLPHKQAGQASPQAAFAAGGHFHLVVTSRLNQLPPDLVRRVENALEIWTLLGSLGLRANRAGGSIWPVGDAAPMTPTELRAKLNALGCTWPVYLAGTVVGNTVEQLRAAATDTVSAPEAIFGRARGGRLASPLKLKVVRLENALRLLITAPREDIITTAQTALRGHRSKPETWQRITP